MRAWNTSLLLLVAAMLLGAAIHTADARPTQLTVAAGFENPLGFHDAAPNFSWWLPQDGSVQRQTAYRLVVATSADRLPDRADLWDSGRVDSSDSVLVAYEGTPLKSRQRVYWQVQYWDENDRPSPWSETAHFELGLLSKTDWRAKWIRPKTKSHPRQEPVASLLRHFEIDREVAAARLYVTARGLFELNLNGSRVGDAYFANGWTSYHNRLDTLTYDVADQLKSGDNRLYARLGKGWYAGRIGWQDQYGVYGNDPELLLQLEILFTDGSSTVGVSDENWKGAWDGPIISSSIYDGEHYDARRQVTNWEEVNVDSNLGPAQLTPKPFAPVRITQKLDVKTITEPQPGRFVFDLGQNMVGWARIHIPVIKDQTITVRYAEMLNPDGTLYLDNYRTAKSINTYTAAESGLIEWEPTFTFHGFRYVELSGLLDGLAPQKRWVTGVVLHTDMQKAGTFESSHDKLNQLQSNIVWGQRGNFLDIPTDCPQRDERMGWTGDAQVFCATSMFNYDCLAFWKSWLGSMRDDQESDGRVPHVIPDALSRAGSPGWQDAATIVPWKLYVRTGDTEILARNYEMMKRLVGWYRSQATDGLITEITAFGDWLQPYAETNRGDTPAPLIGTAFYAYSAQILADSARVLKRDEDAERYAAEADFVRQAFANHYFDADMKLTNAPETQTGYLLAIAFELIGPDDQEKAAAHLVRLVNEADNHLRTGFLGTPHILPVLDQAGYPELAYELLLKETYPSWFYSINQGATTMWERWNSFSHENGFGDASMNSFNHYAYGAVGQWMAERVAGLAPDPRQPGYRHFYIQPQPGTPLTRARAEYRTPYGLAVSGWKKGADGLTIEATVPPNTTATLVVPTEGGMPTVIESGQRQELIQRKDRFELSLTPGHYNFTVTP